MNSERVTPKNAAKELQMDVITLRELMKREKLPIGYGKMVYFQRKGIFWEKQNWEKLMMKLGKHLI